MSSLASTQPPPLPKLTYDAKAALPVQQLKSLRNYLDQLLRRIKDLQDTVNAHGRIEGPSWPELLTKYNNILQQTVLIFEQLSVRAAPPGLPAHIAAALAASSNDAWPRPPPNALPNVLLHPTKVIPPGVTEMAVIGLVGTSRPPALLESDINSVKRFELERDIKLGITPDTKKGLGDKSQIEPVTAHHHTPAHVRSNANQGPPPEEILREMEAHRKEWDARAERAFRAVQMLKEKYHWKVRPDFHGHDLDVEAEEARKQKEAARALEARQTGVADTGSPEVREIVDPRKGQLATQGVESNDEQEEVETEDQVMVEAGESDEEKEDEDMVDAVNAAGGSGQNDVVIGTTPDSDDDLFEEVA